MVAMRIVILLFLAGLWSQPVFAENYAAKYDVYAGGIHALQARLDYQESAKSYDVSIASETYGILDKIVPWQATLQTKGQILKGKMLPQTHKADTTTRKKHEINTYNYDKSGALVSFQQIVNGKDETRKDLDPAIYKDTIDVMTAIFSLIGQVEAGKGCEMQPMVFDSERSYRLIFKNGTKETLIPNKYSSFSGEAIGCAFEVQPEGGKWHKKPRGWMKIQNQAKKSGKMPMIYFANLSKTDTPVYAPVRTVIKTDLGTFIAHLTSFEEKP